MVSSLKRVVNSFQLSREGAFADCEEEAGTGQVMVNSVGSVRWLPLSLRDISLKEGDKDFSAHYLF